ncbi:MAG: nucleotide sugar dehydrogenase [Bryobacteraceae bacterium]
MSQTSRVAVFGLGYVGCVSAACLARLGHFVIGVDRDEFKVRSVREGRAPFHEPGLEELVREGTATEHLTATTTAAEALAFADIALVCVGTPSERNGNLGTEQLERVAAEIAACLPGRNHALIVAIRSTVFPGTCEELVMPHFAEYPGVTVLSHPEFLREGSAVRDFMAPSLLVIGGSDQAAMERVARLYAVLKVDPCLVSLRTAEMIKYACNAFHALKISFANEIGTLSSQIGVSGDEVMDTLCRDAALNISRAYLKPGFAFGGSCLPKDLRALTYRAGRLDLDLPLLQSILPSNMRHLDRAIQSVLDLTHKRIGFFGLSFKENTDDLRESPVVALLEQMIGKGRDVRVFDPHIELDRIYGSNQRFILSAIPHIARLLDSSLEDTLGWADCLVLTQKPQLSYAGMIRKSGLPLIHLAGNEGIEAN